MKKAAWFLVWTLGFGLFSALPVLPPSAWADLSTDAAIDGSRQKVKLYFNHELETLIERFKLWEAELSAQGHRIEFRLGAGELRRALLGMSATGPGDVEIFIFFHDHRFPKLSIPAALLYLESLGIDLRRGVRDAVGEHKKLDIFIKDQRGTGLDTPFMSDKGMYKEMGDVSINRMTYAVSSNRIHGFPEDLEALERREIVFTERVKAARLNEPKQIGKNGPKIHYPKTILRMALRELRLKIDLALAPNPNRLEMDGSFSEVLRGFELYFQDFTDEQIRKTSLEVEYIEQFLKLFREKSPAELRAIQRRFETEWPRTHEILKALGLDVQLLCKRNSARLGDAARELKAVMHQAQFSALLPFVDTARGTVSNPFTDPSWLPVLTQEKLDRWIPDEVLYRLSAALYYRVRNFDQLGFFDQNDVIKEYQRAVGLLHDNAWKRLFKQVTFQDEAFFKFSYVRAALLHKEDPRSLFQFVLDETRAASAASSAKTRLPRAQAFNRNRVEELEARISKTHASGKVPVVFVDLDDTLSLFSVRLVELLRKYDQMSSTRDFEGSDPRMLYTSSVEDFLFERLGKRIKKFKELSEAVETLRAYLAVEGFSREALENDVFARQMVAHLLRWQGMGARIVYVTSRGESVAEASRQALEKAGLPGAPLIMRPREQGEDAKSSPKANPQRKAFQIRAYLEANPECAGVALFENERNILATVAKENPGVEPFQVVYRYEPGKTQPEVFFVRNAAELYQVARTRGCEDWLAQ